MVLGLKHSWRFSWEIYRSGHFCLSSDRVTDSRRLVTVKHYNLSGGSSPRLKAPQFSVVSALVISQVIIT